MYSLLKAGCVGLDMSDTGLSKSRKGGEHGELLGIFKISS